MHSRIASRSSSARTRRARSSTFTPDSLLAAGRGARAGAAGAPSIRSDRVAGAAGRRLGALEVRVQRPARALEIEPKRDRRGAGKRRAEPRAHAVRRLPGAFPRHEKAADRPDRRLAEPRRSAEAVAARGLELDHAEVLVLEVVAANAVEDPAGDRTRARALQLVAERHRGAQRVERVLALLLGDRCPLARPEISAEALHDAPAVGVAKIDLDVPAAEQAPQAVLAGDETRAVDRPEGGRARLPREQRSDEPDRLHEAVRPIAGGLDHGRRLDRE